MCKINVLGSCSVESSDQILKTALSLKGFDFDYLRGSVWKPRTRLSKFNGIGNVGLKYLKSAGEKINKPVICEVFTVDNVKKACNFGIDAYWIGARTTGNSVIENELIKEIKRNKKPVFIKNPFNGDYNQWMGSIERFLDVNINVIGIHRGVFSKKNIYRNTPCWNTAKDIKKFFGIPVLTDPSHMTGNSKYLEEVINVSKMLGFDGLFMEIHNDPKNAKTDANQQVTALDFLEIKREPTFKDFRNSINCLDNEIVNILEQRFFLTEEIGKLKTKTNAPFKDRKREEEIINKTDKDYIKKVFEKILDTSKKQW